MTSSTTFSKTEVYSLWILFSVPTDSLQHESPHSLSCSVTLWTTGGSVQQRIQHATVSTCVARVTYRAVNGWQDNTSTVNIAACRHTGTNLWLLTATRHLWLIAIATVHSNKSRIHQCGCSISVSDSKKKTTGEGELGWREAHKGEIKINVDAGYIKARSEVL